MKVRVKDGMTGYFDHIRRREGDVFTIPDEPRRLPFKTPEKNSKGEPMPPRAQDECYDAVVKSLVDEKGMIPAAYSARWMEPAEANEPERTTSAPAALKKQHDRLLKESAGKNEI